MHQLVPQFNHSKIENGIWRNLELQCPLAIESFDYFEVLSVRNQKICSPFGMVFTRIIRINSHISQSKRAWENSKDKPLLFLLIVFFFSHLFYSFELFLQSSQMICKWNSRRDYFFPKILPRLRQAGRGAGKVPTRRKSVPVPVSARTICLKCMKARVGETHSVTDLCLIQCWICPTGDGRNNLHWCPSLLPEKTSVRILVISGWLQCFKVYFIYPSPNFWSYWDLVKNREVLIPAGVITGHASTSSLRSFAVLAKSRPGPASGANAGTKRRTSKSQSAVSYPLLEALTQKRTDRINHLSHTNTLRQLAISAVCNFATVCCETIFSNHKLIRLKVK